MKKTFELNCGTAIVFDTEIELFRDFEKGFINAGTFVASTEAYRKLAERNISINSGTLNIVKVGDAPIVNLGENPVLSNSNGYQGKYLVATENLVITPKGAENLAGIAGLYVEGNCYYPNTLELSTLENITIAENHVPYPAKAKLIRGDFTVEEKTKMQWKTEEELYITGTATIIDLNLAGKTIPLVTAKKIVIAEELFEEMAPSIRSDDIRIVPKNHKVVGSTEITPVTLVMYGTAIYVAGDLLIQPAGVSLLEKYTSIVVEKTLSITLEGITLFQEIGTANSIEPFEGELISANGSIEFAHATLQTMLANNIVYTIQVNGTAKFEKDVTAEDLQAIAQISYNGVLQGTNALKPILLQKAKGNGIFASIDEGEGLESIVRAAVGAESAADESIVRYNMGELLAL